MRKSKLIQIIVSALLVVSFMIVNFKGAYAADGMHTVTFIYGTNSVSVQVPDGGDAIVPTNTEVPGYTFAGWVGNASGVTEDRTILGAYVRNDAVVAPVTSDVPVQNQTNWTKVNGNVTAPEPNVSNLQRGVPGQTVAVHWYNGWTGALIRDDIVPYGSTIGNVPDPTCAGLEFSGWEGSWENITEDRSIKAWYYQVHKVSFVDGLTGATFNTQYIRNGEDASLPTIPHHNGYHFDSIVGDYKGIYGDTTITIMYGSDYSWHDTYGEYWWLDIDPDGCGQPDDYWWM